MKALLAALVLAALAGTLTAVFRGRPEDGATASAKPGGHRSDGIDLAADITAFTSHFAAGRGYREPDRADRRGIADAVGLVLDGHRAEAVRRLSERDFTLTEVRDRVSGHRYAEIADRTETSVTPRGWGRVYVPLDAPARWSVQVPHPVADRNSERLGVRVLRGAPGGVLVLAGAHRRAGRGDTADVAHRTDTVFQAVCAELARRGMPAVQVHGFAADSAPGYDVIASTASGSLGRPDGRRLADALRARDFRVCRAWVRHCPLEGTENTQSHTAENAHTVFLHVEFAPALRADGPASDRAAAAVAVLTRSWAAAG